MSISRTAGTQSFTQFQIFFFSLSLSPLGAEAHGRTNSLKWIVKLTCGSFQRGNSISLRSVWLFSD